MNDRSSLIIAPGEGKTQLGAQDGLHDLTGPHIGTEQHWEPVSWPAYYELGIALEPQLPRLRAYTWYLFLRLQEELAVDLLGELSRGN